MKTFAQLRPIGTEFSMSLTVRLGDRIGELWYRYRVVAHVRVARWLDDDEGGWAEEVRCVGRTHGGS